MTAPLEAQRSNRIAWASAAVARIRIRRALARRATRERFFDFTVTFLISLVVTGAMLLAVLTLLEATDRHVFKRSPLLAWTLVSFGGAAGITALVLGVLSLWVPLAGPSALATWFRARRSRRAREGFEDELARTGEVVSDDEVVLRAIARDDSVLQYDVDRHAVTVACEALPERCPRCGACLLHPSPGLRRCAHCEFERFDEPATRPAELVAARALIDKVLSGEPFSGDRSALWRAFKRSSRLVAPGQALGTLAGGLAFALLGELADIINVRWLRGIANLGVGLIGVGTAVVIPIALYQLFTRRFRKFKPGCERYDRAIAVDIVSTLAQQGVMTRPALAAHLAISLAHLDQLLARLHALGVPAAYHDAQRDRLVSLHARTDLASCPACGGTLAVGALARLACTHCGGTVAPPR